MVEARPSPAGEAKPCRTGAIEGCYRSIVDRDEVDDEA